MLNVKRKVEPERNVWRGGIAYYVQGLLAVAEFGKRLLGKLGEADR